MGAQVRGEFASAFGDAMSMMDSFSAKWRENSIAAAKARLAAKADEIRGDKTDKAAKGPKTTEALSLSAGRTTIILPPASAALLILE